MDDVAVTLPAGAAGQRSTAGFVGVDSGTMMLADGDLFEELAADFDVRENGCGRRQVTCTSGLGDGSYDVVEIRDADEDLIGIEVVFLSATIEAAAEAAAAADTSVTEPAAETVEAYHAALRERTEAAPDVEAAMNAWYEHQRTHLHRAWDQLICDVDPNADGDPAILGTVVIGESIGVGDPCYGSPTDTFEAAGGAWVAVAWTADLGDWGKRTVRVGLYRPGARARRRR